MLARFIRTIWTLKRTDAGDNKKHNQSWAITISVLVSAMLCVWAVNYNRKVPFLTFVNMYSCTDGCVLLLFFFFFLLSFPHCLSVVFIAAGLWNILIIYPVIWLLLQTTLCQTWELQMCLLGKWWISPDVYVRDISISISIYVDISL